MSYISPSGCFVGPLQASDVGNPPSTTMLAWGGTWGPVFFNGTVTFELFDPSMVLIQTHVIPVTVLDQAICAPPYIGYPLSGTYTMKLTRNDTGESGTSTRTVSVFDPEYSIVTQVLANTTCGLSNGSFRFYHHGAIQLNISYPYTVYDSGSNIVATGTVNGLTWSVVSGLAPGIYTIRTNVYYFCQEAYCPGCPACRVDLNVFIDQTVTIGGSTNSITIDDTIVVDSSCQSNDGSIEIVASSTCSTSGLVIAWTGPNGFTGNTFLIEGLLAGTYSYTITDCACTLTGSVEVIDSGCCWTLTSCTLVCGEIVTIPVTNDLSQLNGQVINGAQISGFNTDIKVCWIVGIGDCGSPSSTLIDFVTSFSNCIECNECPLLPCGCLPGYIQDPGDLTKCIKEIPAVVPECNLDDCSIVKGPNSGAYTGESRVYPVLNSANIPITIEITPTRFVDSSLTDFNSLVTMPVNACWGLGFGGPPYYGRLNEIGIWTGDPGGAPFLQFIGFEVCVEVPVSRTYYVGFATDNAGRFFVDGTLYVDSYYVPNAHQPFAYNYWHMFPVVLTTGTHIIRIEGLNESAGPNLGSFGAEIYDATLSELQACTVPAALTGNNSQGRPLVVWNTLQMVGQSWQTGVLGYTCPDGFELDTCGGVPVCKRSIPFVQCPDDVTCDQSKPGIVKIYFQVKESECDIQTIERFAQANWDNVKELRYGVTSCNPSDLDIRWLKKELSNLALMTLPIACSEPPVSGCCHPKPCSCC